MAEDGGHNLLYRVAADGTGSPEPELRDVWVTSFDCAAGRVVHAATTSTSPGEIYAGERRLTEVTEPFTSAVELVQPERFTALSEDGSEIEAWVSAHFKAVTAGGTTVYDLSRRTS